MSMWGHDTAREDSVVVWPRGADIWTKEFGRMVSVVIFRGIDYCDGQKPPYDGIKRRKRNMKTGDVTKRNVS
jgi:hypothetical protein